MVPGVMMNSLLISLTVTAALLFFYHHFFYPKLLKILASKYAPVSNAPKADAAEKAFITVILPCYNEAKYIGQKLFNFAYLDYPTDRFKVIVVNDGSTDQTVAVFQQTIQHPLLKNICFELRDFNKNRGKIAVVNQVLAEQPAGLVCLSDVSALISIDAFKLINNHMQDPTVGVVAASYGLLNPGSAGEATYWQYQVAIKQHESAMGSTLGVHGALYCIRAELFQPLSADSINDDFMIPMQVIAQGYRVQYDANIVGVELEQSTQQLDFHRRVRIAAGNVQQVIRLRHLLLPKFGAVAFNFFSGKCLRIFMPFCMLMMLLGSAVLAFDSNFWLFVTLLQALIYGTAAWVHWGRARTWPKSAKLVHYLVLGHLASLAGWWLLLRRSSRIVRWRKFEQTSDSEDYLPVGARIGKRSFDLFFASLILVLTLPLWAIIAVMIKLESPGPVFFRQLRIGQCNHQVSQLFYMIKFRSMVQDAEKNTGAVWATKQDSRVTRVGRFLRKTRLDELPQMINVLRGEMSLVGPRPERPELCANLEQHIPYFTERTCFVRPGITGLAQVNLGYDSCLDDVRNKVLYDHSYALALHSVRGWLKMDLHVMVRTIMIMILGRGQ